MNKRIIVILLVALLPMMAMAQDDDKKVTISGSLQTDILFPQVDTVIGTAKEYDFPVLSNTFLDLKLNSKYVTAGTRLELLNNPLPGYETAYKGAGIPHFYVSGGYKWFQATIGDFYDQFGSGLIFRAYEDRPLGIDNSLRGARFVLTPYKGITIKALGGMQRRYFNMDTSNYFGFDYGQEAILGADIELNIEEWVPRMMDNNYRLMVGASWVSKYEQQDDIYVSNNGEMMMLNQPEWVGAADFRVNFVKGGWNVLAEYAYKANDPSFDNGYTYKPGSAILFSGSYSQKGMSFLVQAKRSETMSFRSERMRKGSAGFINHLPAFSMTHTYALAAMYPYATQPDGEWAFSAEARYTFPRKTAMGGKYGTSFRLHGTYIVGLQTPPEGYKETIGSDGFRPKFFGVGDETNYLDVHLEFSKKIHKTFSMNAMYMYQQYNQKVVEGKGHNGDIVKSHIGVAELKYRPNKNIGMRLELQYLHTRQDKGDWAYALYEISLFRKVLLEISDMYNIGETKQHYYRIGATYTEGAHRIQLAYGRTREGYNCSGGICRYVPASKGLSVSYKVNF